MKSYTIPLFFHFLGMIGLFIGYGLEWAASGLLRRATTAEQARAWLAVYKMSLPISGPGLLLLILTGGYLATFNGGMGQSWIIVTWVGIAIALFIGFVLILPIVKSIRGSLPESGALSAETLGRIRQPLFMTLVRVRLWLALGIVYLMLLKPATLGSGLVALVIAGIVGVIFAAPAWAKSKPA